MDVEGARSFRRGAAKLGTPRSQGFESAARGARSTHCQPVAVVHKVLVAELGAWPVQHRARCAPRAAETRREPESAGLARSPVRSAPRPAWASGRWRAARLEEGVRPPFWLHPAPPDLLRLLLCVARVHEHEQIDVGFHMHDEDVVNAQSQVTLLMSNGGRPGPALREVARSGMLAEAIKQLTAGLTA